MCEEEVTGTDALLSRMLLTSRAKRHSPRKLQEGNSITLVEDCVHNWLSLTYSLRKVKDCHMSKELRCPWKWFKHHCCRKMSWIFQSIWGISRTFNLPDHCFNKSNIHKLNLHRDIIFYHLICISLAQFQLSCHLQLSRWLLPITLNWCRSWRTWRSCLPVSWFHLPKHWCWICTRCWSLGFPEKFCRQSINFGDFSTLLCQGGTWSFIIDFRQWSLKLFFI